MGCREVAGYKKEQSEKGTVQAGRRVANLFIQENASTSKKGRDRVLVVMVRPYCTFRTVSTFRFACLDALNGPGAGLAWKPGWKPGLERFREDGGRGRC